MQRPLLLLALLLTGSALAETNATPWYERDGSQCRRAPGGPYAAIELARMFGSYTTEDIKAHGVIVETTIVAGGERFTYYNGLERCDASRTPAEKKAADHANRYR